MSESQNTNSGGLYFVVGGLAAIVFGIVLYFGGFVGGYKTKTTTIEHSIGPDSSSTTSTTTTKSVP